MTDELTQLANDERAAELERRIDDLESRLEWLEATDPDDLDAPDDADESVLRGKIKMRRRLAREQLKRCREMYNELTNDEGADDE
ncbi:uncharacterized protein NP_5340A [Natronomonas pharaonis DSM 2160]|uniref:Uncharacterized protein n=1 Tax=Natronomonas pharaonis (strain ATCC 35678 / DSM 2160 / CIP 103997 / JCM 8858 / NBRC 14720 / NCIMB 2260 / Gabara) TaxID=348780 RepID=A0A1U7EZK7_NATPD|nr:hypothetical protein [Natronomonas pharaonis]CAI50761.1 uncharacterized protein NP_5340A [Natronomonas pharaonis DSM 2160]